MNAPLNLVLSIICRDDIMKINVGRKFNCVVMWFFYYQGNIMNMLDVRFYKNLWGVAIIELDSHPDHNKGPDHAPCAGP